MWYIVIRPKTTGIKGVLYSNGDWQTATGSYGSISDEKYKQDITTMRNYWDDFKALTYRKWKDKLDVACWGDAAAPRIGLIAQEVENIFPSYFFPLLLQVEPCSTCDATSLPISIALVLALKPQKYIAIGTRGNRPTVRQAVASRDNPQIQQTSSLASSLCPPPSSA